MLLINIESGKFNFLIIINNLFDFSFNQVEKKIVCIVAD